MTDPNVVFDIGDWAKPVTVFVEKVFEVVGVLMEPSRIRQESKAKADSKVMSARADAEVARIQAEVRMDISDSERRALRRKVIEEARHQVNMEHIVAGALPFLKGDATPEKIEDDWIANIFDKCRIVSDREMQQVWSRLLAGEANSPGSFSRKTINLIPDLEKSDAAIFTTLCRFCWTLEIQKRRRLPIILDYREDIYQKNNMTFDNLTHLDNLGLIDFSVSGEYGEEDLPRQFEASYHGEKIGIILQGKNISFFPVGQVWFTQAGKELASICQFEEIPGFVEYVKASWQRKGLVE